MSATTSEPRDLDDSEPELKRVMGPGLLLLFIVGDILGAGVYAVTGKLAGQVGGVAWLPFLVAFGVATLTAFSYLELVSKYPQAAGAALYAHKAFGIHFVTFLVAFAVVVLGHHQRLDVLGPARQQPAARPERGHRGGPHGRRARPWSWRCSFMVLLAVINLRGVGESVKFNVVLTLIEMAALAIVIVIGFVAIGGGRRRPRPDHGVREPRPEGALRRGHRRHGDRVLLDGRVRGLGEHGRGDQGPRADLPADDADRPRHRGDHLHARGDLGGRGDPRGPRSRSRRTPRPASCSTSSASAPRACRSTRSSRS